jgi:hypothetical protein
MQQGIYSEGCTSTASSTASGGETRGSRGTRSAYESNPDRVEHFRPAPGEKIAAGYVPRDRVTMRVSSALHTKADNLRKYRDRAVIGPNDQAVIAINVRDIPHGVFEAETYGLGATYGLGPQYVVIDRGTGEPVDSGYQHRPQLLSTKGASVDVAPFLHEGLAQRYVRLRKVGVLGHVASGVCVTSTRAKSTAN